MYIPTSVTSIASNAFRSSPNVTIKGSYGSYAEEYAKANNIPFNGISAYDVGDVNMDDGIDILDALLFRSMLPVLLNFRQNKNILPIITMTVTSR